MQPYIRPILIGFGVAVALGVVLRLVLGPGLSTTACAAFIGIFVAYILSNLAGNRKVAEAGADAKSAALRLTPPPGEALLVVYREGFVAKLAGLDLALDGREFAQLTSPRFTCLPMSPGAHTLSGAFGGLAGAQSKAASFTLQATPGEVIAIRINARMGAVQGAVRFTPDADVEALKRKLASRPMVAATLARAEA